MSYANVFWVVLNIIKGYRVDHSSFCVIEYFTLCLGNYHIYATENWVWHIDGQIS